MNSRRDSGSTRRSHQRVILGGRLGPAMSALRLGCASFRCQDLFDNEHRNYAGDLGTSISPQLAARVKESDLLIVVGARLGEMTTSGYSLVKLPKPDQTLVHAYMDPGEMGRVYRPDLAVCASMDQKWR